MVSLARVVKRNLVRPPEVLDLLPVDLLRSRPSLRSAQHDHRPLRPLGAAVLARLALDRLDLRDDLVQGLSHRRMHLLRIRPLDVVRLVPVADEEARQLVLRHPGEHGRVRDLVPVQVQDRQDGAVRRRVQELVRVPRRGERPGFRLAVADDARDDQVRVVECGSERVRERVAELAALVDRARHFGRGVARDPARERELLEQSLNALRILGDVRIHLAVRPLQVRVRHDRGAPVPGTADVDHVQVVRLDDPVQVDVDEVQARSRPPVAE